MSDYALNLWERATEALSVAEHDLLLSPDATASRAYYAASYAASAHFALTGRTFTKHSAVETAVHRDLVKTGAWPVELGPQYSRLIQLRTTGDYGHLNRVSPGEAREALDIARQVLRTVQQVNSGRFSRDGISGG